MNLSTGKLFAYALIISILIALLTGCKSDNTDNANNNAVKAGKYTATEKGYGGDVTVNVTVDGTGKITAVNVTADAETPDIGGKAAPMIANSIVEKQSLSIDAISGATVTSNAVLKAAKKAIEDSGVKVDNLK
ncbi:FMN-binding protein [Clostridium sp. Marseille-P299]|uniref:FMN-binding protein n=1 Tax=Clostridium sp. Marseille-P299 TaxID=1805477 RepID=UPI000831CF1A|nr:FMN-binding protein [Clostridium sp. Marseille-P299]